MTKKKQALDDLLNEGRISQSTHGSLNKELTDAITEIEARRKALAEKVTSRIGELQQQITVLEMFLASSEIEYAAGEIDDELHQRESDAFALGLEATKQELDAVKEVVANLLPKEPVITPPTLPSEITEQPQKEELVETPPEIPVEAAVEPEAIPEAISEAEEEPAEEEEFQLSEEVAEEAAEETTETSEVAEETDVEEAYTDEEATTEEEEYWE